MSEHLPIYKEEDFMVSDANESDKVMKDVPYMEHVSDHVLFRGMLAIVIAYNEDTKVVRLFTYEDSKIHNVNTQNEQEVLQIEDLM